MRLSTESGVKVDVRHDKPQVKRDENGPDHIISHITVETFSGKVTVRTYNDGTMIVDTEATESLFWEVQPPLSNDVWTSVRIGRK